MNATRTLFAFIVPASALLFCPLAEARVEVADVFGPEMVLQRDAPVPI